MHLGRLSRFYPGCRECSHRDQTATLSARLVKRLAETRRQDDPDPLFGADGASGVYLNQLDPAWARKIARALGTRLYREMTGEEARPEVVIAGDGRLFTPELLAAVAEGLRWAGCGVIDVGAATAPCTAYAVAHLGAAAGVLVGNPTVRVHTVGLRFWAKEARPLGTELLAYLSQVASAEVDRPVRKSGPSRRFQAEIPYLGDMAHSYHALRPLRFVLDTASEPLACYLAKLLEPVACRAIRCRVLPGELAKQIVEDRAHFAVRIDDDARRCRLIDDRGRDVAGERFCSLIAEHLTAEQSNRPIVLEDGTPVEAARRITNQGAQVFTCSSEALEIDRVMRRTGAIFAGGPDGRFWYPSTDGHNSADALVTLTHLLRLLSQSDRRLSEVLDDSHAAK